MTSVTKMVVTSTLAPDRGLFSLDDNVKQYVIALAR